jgi:hypothetical protein
MTQITSCTYAGLCIGYARQKYSAEVGRVAVPSPHQEFLQDIAATSMPLSKPLHAFRGHLLEVTRPHGVPSAVTK